MHRHHGSAPLRAIVTVHVHRPSQGPVVVSMNRRSILLATAPLACMAIPGLLHAQRDGGASITPLEPVETPASDGVQRAFSGRDAALVSRHLRDGADSRHRSIFHPQPGDEEPASQPRAWQAARPEHPTPDLDSSGVTVSGVLAGVDTTVILADGAGHAR